MAIWDGSHGLTNPGERPAAAPHSARYVTSTSAQHRGRLKYGEVITQLDKLDPTLVWSVDRHDAMEIVAKTDLIKLAAAAQRVELLPEVLDDCRILFWYGLLPEDLPMH